MNIDFSSSSFFKVCSEEIQAFAKQNESAECITQKFITPDGKSEDYFARREQVIKTSQSAVKAFATLEVKDDLFKSNRKTAIKWIQLFSEGAKIGALDRQEVAGVVTHFHKIFKFKAGDCKPDMALTVKEWVEVKFSSAFFYNHYIDAFSGQIVLMDTDKEVGEALVQYSYEEKITLTSPVHLVQLFTCARRFDNIPLMKICAQKYSGGSEAELQWLQKLIEAYDLRDSDPGASEQKFREALTFREDFLIWAAIAHLCEKLKKDPEEALKKALKLNPADPFLQQKMGMLLLKRKKVSAETHLRRALTKICPSDLLFAVGKLELKKGNYKEAQELFERLIRKSPLPSYRYLHARSLLLKGDYAQAEELMLLLYHTQNERSIALGGLLLHALIAKPLAWSRYILEIFELPDDERKRAFKEVLKGLILLAKPEEIANLYQIFTEDQKTKTRAVFVDVLMRQAQKEGVQSKYYLEQAYGIDSSSPQVLEALCNVAEKEKNVQEAVSYLLQLAYGAEKRDEEKTFYTRAATLLPTCLEAQNGLIAIAKEEKDTPELLHRSALSLNADPDQPLLYEEYVKAVIVDPSVAQRVIQILGRLETSTKKELIIVVANPNYHTAIMNLLLERSLDEAEFFDSKSTETKNRQARVAFEKGDTDTYMQKLQESLAIDPLQIVQRGEFVCLQIKDETLRERVLATIGELEAEEIKTLLLQPMLSTSEQIARALLMIAEKASEERAEKLYSKAHEYAPKDKHLLNDWADFRARRGLSVKEPSLLSLLIDPHQPFIRNRLIDELAPDESAGMIQVVRKLDLAAQAELFAKIQTNGTDALPKITHPLPKTEQEDSVDSLERDSLEEVVLEGEFLEHIPFLDEVLKNLPRRWERKELIDALQTASDAKVACLNFILSRNEPGKLLEIAAKIDPASKEVVNAQGRAHFRAARRAEYVENLFTSLEIDSTQEEILSDLVHVLFSNKEHAVRVLSMVRASTDRKGFIAALRKGPANNVDGVVTWLLSQESDRLDWRVCELDATCPTLNALAKRAFAREKKSVAIDYLQQSLDKGPDQLDIAREFIQLNVSDPALVDTICTVLSELDSYERRRIYTSKMDRRSIARTLMAIGDEKSDILLYNRALDVNPDDEDTLNRVASKYAPELSIPLLLYSLQKNSLQSRLREVLIKHLASEYQAVLHDLHPEEAMLFLLEFYDSKNVAKSFLKVLEETKEIKRKKAIIDRVLFTHPILELYQERFSLAFDEANMIEAIDLCDQIVEHFPEEQKELICLLTHYNIPHFEALTSLEAVVLLYKLQTENSPVMALVDMARGDSARGGSARADVFLDVAQNLAENLAETIESCTMLFNEAAKLAFAQGNVDKALQKLARSLILDPEQPFERKQFLSALGVDAVLAAKMSPLFLQLSPPQINVLVTTLLEAKTSNDFVNPLVSILIQFARETANSDDAQKAYERALAFAPHNAEVLEALSRLNPTKERHYLALQSAPNNKELVHEYLELLIKDVELRSKVLNIMQSMNTDEVKKFTASLHRNPPIVSKIAEIILRMARNATFLDGMRYYQMASNVLPESPEILLEWADYADEGGGNGQGYRLRALRINPEQPRVKLQVVNDLYPSESKKVLKAIRDLGEDLQKELWGRICEEKAGALIPFLVEKKKFVSALRLQPKSPEILSALFTHLETIKELPKKIRICDAALAVVSSLELINMRFSLSLQRGDVDAALNFLFKSLEMDATQEKELYGLLCHLLGEAKAITLVEAVKQLSLEEKYVFLPNLCARRLPSDCFLRVGRRFPERLAKMETFSCLIK
jgi:tetratricopeptide (TPR) repeat protein